MVYVSWLFSSSRAVAKRRAPAEPQPRRWLLRRPRLCTQHKLARELPRVALARIELHNCGATE